MFTILFTDRYGENAAQASDIVSAFMQIQDAIDAGADRVQLVEDYGHVVEIEIDDEE